MLLSWKHLYGTEDLVTLVKRLNTLAKEDVLPGLKDVDLDKCSHCMAGKQTRVSFQRHPPSRKLK